MSTLHAEYLAEIIQAHREGLKALRDLLTAETDPAERRRLAIALVRARPVADPCPEPADQTAPPRRTRRTPAHLDPEPAPTPAVEPQPLAPAAGTHAPPTIPTPPQEPRPLPDLAYPRLQPGRQLLEGPPCEYDCTHPALPPYPGYHLDQVRKRARSA
ncbi:MAG: hypothetical protein K2Q09_04815 [Phycisphaerales bacterium]|nr:hypothetical protein [Phycisphaerales bacterium]